MTQVKSTCAWCAAWELRCTTAAHSKYRSHELRLHCFLLTEKASARHADCAESTAQAEEEQEAVIIQAWTD